MIVNLRPGPWRLAAAAFVCAMQPARAKESVAPGRRPAAIAPIEKKEAGKNAETVEMNFDKRDLADVIHMVSTFTQRNFILPEHLTAKITILSNAPIPADEVWSVFLAALDANGFSVYQVGSFWKLVEKKTASHSTIPLFLEPGAALPVNEQMVTKLFKLHYLDAEQLKGMLGQFGSRDSELQIFGPETLIVSDVALNLQRLERLIETLDQPGGSAGIHVVQVQFAQATALAQRLTDLFVAPAAQKGPARRALTVAGAAGEQGPISVEKIGADDRTNKLIIVCAESSFARVTEILRQLDSPVNSGGIHVYSLRNAKADELAASLQGLSPGGGAKKGAGAVPLQGSTELTGEVKITAERNTNSLLITASESDYRSLVKVIERLDLQRQQVFVEAVIMEINLQDDDTFALSAHAGDLLGSKGNMPGVLGSELGGLSSLGGVSSLSALSGFLAGLQGPALTVSGITLPSLSLVLNALQTSSDVNVISTPHVLMADNTEGEVTVGQNVPYQAAYSPASSAVTSATATTVASLSGISSLYAPIQRQNVELKLHIKPQINQGDSIRLEVEEQTEEIASVDKTLGPTTSKRSTKTTVIAQDQTTVVLGGLMQERTVRSVQKVPILGSIPILGRLFRSEETKKTKTNLLLFLTPYIIRDPSDYRRIFERKLAERAEFQKQFQGGEVGTVDYSKKPGLLERIDRGVQDELKRAENGGAGAADELVVLAPARRK